MRTLSAGYSKTKTMNQKGQLKIQQMAFVLVALMIFFAMAALFYFSIRSSNLRQDVEALREGEIMESVRKMSGSAEFAWTSAGDCSSCIDFDKVLMLKNRTSYKGFWKNIALLKIERVYPVFGEGTECTRENYPMCDGVTLIDEDKDFRSHRAFVALCRHESEGYNRCDLGKIVMAFETIE